MIHLSHESQASAEDTAAIENALYRYNMDITGDHVYTPVNIFLRDEQNTLHGAILCGMWGGWMHIHFLWIDEPFRRHGYGAQLLAAAEAQAQTAACQAIYLETFDFQGRDFYLKYGYSIVGELKNYPPGHSHYFMQKILQDHS